MAQAQQRTNEMNTDPRGEFPSYRSFSDLCWATEDFLQISQLMLGAFQAIKCEIEYLKRNFKMDKKMHQVTKRMKTAVKDVKKCKPAAAVKVLKKADKKNEKLVKIDRDVRDPLIKKCKEDMKKKPAPKKK